MKYKVESLQFLQEDVEEFDNYKDAERSAVRASWDDFAHGIWIGQHDDSELVAIVFGQQVFKPPIPSERRLK